MIPIVFDGKSIFDAIWLIVSPLEYGGGLNAVLGKLFFVNYSLYKPRKLHPLKTI